jgi:hypothetical protein
MKNFTFIAVSNSGNRKNIQVEAFNLSQAFKIAKKEARKNNLTIIY